jgi:D-beta-D-heptose 7-phosphate kinase / D-beta-D-heptose 1-phosphate adenosyltransferase
MNPKEIIDMFPEVRIAVVGDIMLDKYVYGSVERVSPEAPVPVVKVDREVYGLGGAGNVAANIASLGGEAYLFGYVGEDNASEILINELENFDIERRLCFGLKQTIQKTRIIGNHQQIVRLDKEDSDTNLYGKLNSSDLYSDLQEIDPDVIIASDYAKGCLNKELFERLKKSGKKIIVDAKPSNKWNYLGVYLITPNLKEGIEMTSLDGVDEIGKRLQKDLGCNVLLTKGSGGMSLFENEKVFNFITQAKEVYDVSGAGDTVVGVMGLGIGAGASLEESAFLANHAAGIVVGKSGTACISRFELEGIIESENKKIMNLNQLKRIRGDLERKSKKVVWTNGCFDLLHEGHVDYLGKAKSLGDYLIVGVNSDASVKKLGKGDNRPINKQESRARLLSALECVDYVTIFSDLRVDKCLRELKPDLYVKGGDYTLESMDQEERKVIESYGGEFRFIPFEKDVSTTDIIDKIRNGSG